VNTLLRVFTLHQSPSGSGFSKPEQSLMRTCEYVAQFWSDILRLNLFQSNSQSFAQALASQTNPLRRQQIDRFQTTLETYLFSELSLLEDSDPEDNEPDFERWVGCLEHGPNTYLAEVAESLHISPLHFPPQTGCYVYPGRVLGMNGKVQRLS
jgi:hypothetical protein